MNRVASRPEAVAAAALTDGGRLNAYALLGLEIALDRIATAHPEATIGDLRAGVALAMSVACVDRALLRADGQADVGLHLLQAFVERREAARPADAADE